MAETVQATRITPVAAEDVLRAAQVREADNGLNYATYGETRVGDAELARLVESVPRVMAQALKRKAYYFVPLALSATETGARLDAGISMTAEDAGETLVAPAYTVELGDRAICHRNVRYGDAECIFISTQLMSDRFALAFEFAINVGHAFVDAVGVPKEFGEMVWRQAEAQARGETSHEAWEQRHLAMLPEAGTGKTRVDERARGLYMEAAFADAVAIYLLSLNLDFDYAELRERDYPLLAPQPLADRLRHVAELFPPNAGYEFAVLYRRKP